MAIAGACRPDRRCRRIHVWDLCGSDSVPGIQQGRPEKKKNVVQAAGSRWADCSAGRAAWSPLSPSRGGFEGLEVANKGCCWPTCPWSPATPVQQGATAAYLQCTVGDNIGKSLTIQRRTRLDWDRAPIHLQGLQALRRGSSQGKVDELLCRSTSMAAAIQRLRLLVRRHHWRPGSPQFHWAQMSVKLGTFGAEAAVSGGRFFGHPTEAWPQSASTLARLASRLSRSQ